MKQGMFITLLASITIAGGAWLYERQLVAEARADLAAAQARVTRQRQRLAQLEHQHAVGARDAAALGPQEEKSLKAGAQGARSTEGRGAIADEAEEWHAQVRRLRDLFTRHPEQSIPELQLLSNLDWLELARQIRPDDDELRARSAVRDRAIRKFLESLPDILRAYRSSNAGNAVSDLTKLAPFFQPAIDPAILARYEIVRDSVTGPRGRHLIVECKPIDEELDKRHYVTTDGSGKGSGPWITLPLRSALAEGFAAYAAANNGRVPDKLSDALSFIHDPVGRGFYEAVSAFEQAHNGRSSDNPVELLPYATSAEARILLERMARASAAKREP